MGRTRIVWLVLIGCIGVAHLPAQTLSWRAYSPEWTVDEYTFDGLPGEASSIDEENTAGDYRLRVSNAPNIDWQVSVSRVDGTWHPGLTLEVKHLSQSNSITTGNFNVYQVVTETVTEFFAGGGNVNNIDLQLRLSGNLSADAVPSGEYTTEVVYTISQVP